MDQLELGRFADYVTMEGKQTTWLPYFQSPKGLMPPLGRLYIAYSADFIRTTLSELYPIQAAVTMIRFSQYIFLFLKKNNLLQHYACMLYKLHYACPCRLWIKII